MSGRRRRHGDEFADDRPWAEDDRPWAENDRPSAGDDGAWAGDPQPWPDDPRSGRGQPPVPPARPTGASRRGRHSAAPGPGLPAGPPDRWAPEPGGRGPTGPQPPWEAPRGGRPGPRPAADYPAADYPAVDLPRQPGPSDSQPSWPGRDDAETGRYPQRRSPSAAPREPEPPRRGSAPRGRYPDSTQRYGPDPLAPAGNRRASGPDPYSAPGSGPFPAPGSGPFPAPGSGPFPAPGSGPFPAAGQDPYPAPPGAPTGRRDRGPAQDRRGRQPSSRHQDGYAGDRPQRPAPADGYDDPRLDRQARRAAPRGPQDPEDYRGPRDDPRASYGEPPAERRDQPGRRRAGQPARRAGPPTPGDRPAGDTARTAPPGSGGFLAGLGDDRPGAPGRGGRGGRGPDGYDDDYGPPGRGGGYGSGDVEYYEEPGGRGGGRPPKRKRRGRLAGPTAALVILIVIVVPLAIGGFFAYRAIESHYNPADYSGAGTGQVIFEVKPGDNADTIGPRLVSAGVVASARGFVLAAEASKNTNVLEPGFYRLHKHMSAALAWGLLLSPSARVQSKVTIPEGFRVSQTLATLAKDSGISASDYAKAIKNTAGLHLPSYAKGNPEGYLFPDTYEIPPDTSATQVLQQMVTAYNHEADSVGLTQAAKHVNLSPAEVITVASLAQAEGGRDSDFPKIAEVIYNRLAQGTKLDLDSTVLFALNKYGIQASDQQLQTNSPYNTYAHTGLPPGPIDSPGNAAIEAALHPAKGGFLYFVTVNPKTGQTDFTASPTVFQQLKNELEQNLAHGG